MHFDAAERMKQKGGQTGWILETARSSAATASINAGCN